MDCHQGSSPVTGVKIADSWLLSAHNTASAANRTGKGAGCRDCHEPPSGHPSGCILCHGGGNPTGAVPLHNPDAALKCYECHAPDSSVDPLARKHINISAPHLVNYTASYVSSRFTGKCRSCHDPHNPTRHIAANREWSESGHGNYTAKPWNYYDFKTRGTASPSTPANSTASDCVRCHTTTGYINYVTSGFTNISGWGKQYIVNLGTVANPNNYNTVDTTKQVLACPACHDDGNNNSYSFAVRSIGAVTGYYNYKTPATAPFPNQLILNSYNFPDLSQSNLCICCHSGREIGDTLKDAAPFLNFANTSFINSHYLTAGATLFAVSGYTFTPPTASTHRNIGRGNLSGTGNKGPCVACHLSTAAKHLYLSVTRTDREDRWSDITAITSTICKNCHGFSEAGLRDAKQGYRAALDILKYQLQQRGFYYQERNPWFFVGALPSSAATTNWVNEQNMGAAFNYNLMQHDPGGFAHNADYVRSLIIDSIDWIDDNIVNGSAGATLTNYRDSVDAAAGTRALNYLGL